MRLESLHLENFRGFEDATLSLDRPLTVLFGENGSGKSSVLMALAICFSRILSHHFRNLYLWRFSDEDVLLGAPESTISLELGHQDRHFSAKLVHTRGVRYSGSPEIDDLADDLRRAAISLLPIAYFAGRTVNHSRQVFEPTDDAAKLSNEAQSAFADALDPGHIGFRSFFLWFKEREDAENRRKVQERNLSATDPQLAAVRMALEGLLPGYTNPRIQHDPLRLEILKGDRALSMDQLSDGEKQVLVMTADIARRLAMVYPNEPIPLAQEAVVMVDEIELHLHPLWQRQILPAWRRVFPGCQFIVTTHSPQVLSEVPNDAVFLIQNFQFFRPGAPTEGHDSNSILEEAMGTPERPRYAQLEVEKIAALIDEEHYSEARERLDALAQRLTESDNEIVRLRVLLHFMEGSNAAGSQG